MCFMYVCDVCCFGGSPLSLFVCCLHTHSLTTVHRRLADHEFLGVLQEYAARNLRLDPSTQSRLQMTYRKFVRSSSDPYKKAVYCLLACCDFNDNHPEVIQKTDDYIWYKVSTSPPPLA